MGNSRANALRRLRTQRPDLHADVVALGETLAHADVGAQRHGRGQERNKRNCCVRFSSRPGNCSP